MEEISTARSARHHYVMGDIKPFISPVTGKEISDRGALRRHMKLHNLANYDEMKGTAERARRDRADRQDRERLSAVVDSYEQSRNNMRSKQRFG